MKLNAKNVLKATVVVVCIIGFLWQTLEFYFLYLTFPTVVDIQVSVPSEIELPGITLCSSPGLKPEVICNLTASCLTGKVMSLPPGFTLVLYQKFATTNDLNTSSLDTLRVPLEDFFNCTITGGSEDRECDLDNVVIGSYYSDTNIPSFCFTLNSKWGDPNREIQRMKTSERIQMEFYVDISNRSRNARPEEIQRPKYNPSDSVSVQIGLHSQRMSQSPYMFGQGFVGGKKYQIKVTKGEKHLLPPPYQTNCTDYVKDWVENNGVAPLNQVMTLHECRMKAALKELGCIPFSVDYPHNYTVCRYCGNDCDTETRIGSSCMDVLQSKNQPCESESYVMNVEEKWVYEIKRLKNTLIGSAEDLYKRKKGFNCTSEGIYTKPCQTINIEMNFDEYQVTNITYNPKFESLELYSVIGGYMGMYLGISLVAVYEFLETAVIVAYGFVAKSKKSKIKKNRWTSQLKKKDRWADFQYPSELRKTRREIY